MAQAARRAGKRPGEKIGKLTAEQAEIARLRRENERLNTLAGMTKMRGPRLRTLRLDDVDLGNRRLTVGSVTRPLVYPLVQGSEMLLALEHRRETAACIALPAAAPLSSGAMAEPSIDRALVDRCCRFSRIGAEFSRPMRCRPAA